MSAEAQRLGYLCNEVRELVGRRMAQLLFFVYLFFVLIIAFTEKTNKTWYI
jgi:hypothetical protein